MSVGTGLKRPINLWLAEDSDQLLREEMELTGKSRTSLINIAIRKTYSKSD
jgi:uncharacterized protein (DUF1778 family)